MIVYTFIIDVYSKSLCDTQNILYRKEEIV